MRPVGGALLGERLLGRATSARRAPTRPPGRARPAGSQARPRQTAGALARPRTGALDGLLERAQPLLVLGLGLASAWAVARRLAGSSAANTASRTVLLDTGTSDALTSELEPISLAARAHVYVGSPAGRAPVADPHLAPAAPAAHQPCQQRPALTRRAAGAAAQHASVGSQPPLVLQYVSQSMYPG